MFGNEFKTWSRAAERQLPARHAASPTRRSRRAGCSASSRPPRCSELETQVVARCATPARQVNTTLKRVEATRKARELAEQSLQAEEKRLAVGLSDTFRVFQAQRDLARQQRQRAERDHRLQPRAGGLRGRADRSAAVSQRLTDGRARGPVSLPSIAASSPSPAFSTLPISHGPSPMAHPCAIPWPMCPSPIAHFCYTPRVKLTVTVITRNEAAHIAAALDVGLLGRRDHRRRLAAAPTTPSRSRERSRDAGRGPRLARLQRAEELRGGDRVATTGSCRSTPTSACRRARRRDPRRCSQRSRRDAAIAMPRVTWYLGRWIRSDRLVSGLPAAALRSARGPLERAARARVGRAAQGAPGRLRHELQHFAYRDISHHLATIDRYTTLAAEQWMAEGRRTSALARRRSTRRWRSCATTSCAAASGTAAPACWCRR